MKLHVLGWFLYLIYSSLVCQAQYYYSNQKDSRSKSVNSSPYFNNNTVPLYGLWSAWSICSTTCGKGISSRTRSCLKSTYNSKGVFVPLCHGPFSEHKICEMEDCSANLVDSREHQCSQHNNQIVAGRLIKIWKPSRGSPNPCELRCEAVGGGEKFVYGFGKVSDGTPCPQGVCMDGRCLGIGCDDRLGSGVSVDMCGMCGGRNSSCVHYKDVFQGQPSVKSGNQGAYHDVVVIPGGARHLIIRQPLGKNLLALQDRNKGIIFDKDHGNHFDIAGSKVEFLKTGGSFEEVLVKGPLTQELYVLVLLRAHNPGIYYEYWLPKHIHTPIRGHAPLKQLSHSGTLTTLPNSLEEDTTPLYKPRTTVFTRKPLLRHHPKPQFAYGYGEKPYKGQESPIFRYTTQSPIFRHTTQHPVRKKGYEDTQSESPYSYHDETKERYPLYKRNARPIQRPGPSFDYYATFRNASRAENRHAAKQQKAADTVDNQPDLTQGDSGSFEVNGRYINSLYELDEDKKSQLADHKPLRRTPVRVHKRVEVDPYKSYVPNGRLKYSLGTKDEDGVRIENHQEPAPLTINVLPGADSHKQHKDTKKVEILLKPRPTREGGCEPCPKSRNQLRHFCLSDFVIQALVIGFEFLQDETRYELEIIKTYKNNLSLQHKEYVWSPDTCRCPKLRVGKEYLLMGRTDSTYRKRESRLVVDNTSFARSFNLKYERRLQRLRRDQRKKCQRIS